MRRCIIPGALVALICCSSAYAGLFSDVYQGLNYAVTPTGSPISPAAGGGFQNGSRFGRVRIVPNRLGDGYRLELDRDFGPDTTGRPEIFNVGVAQLQLQGQTQTTAEYTSRFHFYSGSITSAINNLNYDLKTKVGAQDAELSGTLNGSATMNINELGFYTLTVNIANTDSNLALDGLVINDPNKDTNFNVGPISVKGNLFADAVAAGASSLGANIQGFDKVFPKSGIATIDSIIANSIATQGSKTGTSSETDAASLGLTTDQLNQLKTSLLSDVTSAMFQQNSGAFAAALAETGSPVSVPEPVTAGWAVLGLLVAFRGRR